MIANKVYMNSKHMDIGTYVLGASGSSLPYTAAKAAEKRT